MGHSVVSLASFLDCVAFLVTCVSGDASMVNTCLVIEPRDIH